MAFHDIGITRMKNNRLLIWLRKLVKRLFIGTVNFHMKHTTVKKITGSQISVLKAFIVNHSVPIQIIRAIEIYLIVSQKLTSVCILDYFESHVIFESRVFNLEAKSTTSYLISSDLNYLHGHQSQFESPLWVSFVLHVSGHSEEL